MPCGTLTCWTRGRTQRCDVLGFLHQNRVGIDVTAQDASRARYQRLYKEVWDDEETGAAGRKRTQGMAAV